MAGTRTTRRKPRQPRAKRSQAFVATAYGPPWTGINGNGVTADGTDLRPAKRAYLVAIPQGESSGLKMGDKIRIWPNPHNYRGSFTVRDVFGPATTGKRLDIYDWRGRAQQLDWGSKDVQVSAGRGMELALFGLDIPNPLDLITPPSGETPGLGNIPGVPGLDLSGIFSGLAAIGTALAGITRFFLGLGELLLTPEGWLRIGKLLFGVIFLLMGLLRLVQVAAGIKLPKIGGAVRVGRRAVVGGLSRG